jgi:hypothetical protein
MRIDDSDPGAGVPFNDPPNNPAPQAQPPVAQNLDFLPTTRPRVLRSPSEDSSDSSAGPEPAGHPGLTFTEPAGTDLDPELDDALLMHCELSADDLLVGSILSKDAQLGE